MDTRTWLQQQQIDRQKDRQTDKKIQKDGQIDKQIDQVLQVVIPGKSQILIIVDMQIDGYIQSDMIDIYFSYLQENDLSPYTKFRDNQTENENNAL